MPLAPLKRVLLWKAVYSQAPLLLLYLLLRTPRCDGFSYDREEVREKQATSGPAPRTWSHHTARGRFPISSLSPTGAGWKGVSLCFRGQPDSLNDSWGLLFWQLLWMLGTARGKTQGSGPLPVHQRRFEISDSRGPAAPPHPLHFENALLGDLMSGRGWDASRGFVLTPKLQLCQENSESGSLPLCFRFPY